MPAAWPILKFLFRVVAPTIPEVVSTISKMRNQEAEQQSQEQDLEHRIAELDRRLAIQLELIDTLSQQIESFQYTLRRTLTIGSIALVLSVIGIVMVLAIK